MTAPASVAQHLNYRGDVTAGLTVGQAMGPNTMGELLYVVEWAYDPAADRTRVGLSYIRPAEATP